ncbi:UDP-3-O-(3-hydroxymyristoyl)glucosamine N-acyltransferase [Sediminibacterium sp.]|uniref:UDP-3-O-(3-hydroxymyristoyl)glucosamine N-acyltransferase n=1 Tax=Sediminibacterium sp. TaxID=1917865 RepID=UPI003F70067E
MISVKEILSVVPEVAFIGNINDQVCSPKNFDEFNKDPSALMWVNMKNSGRLADISCGTVICPQVDESIVKQGVNYIICPNPRKTFAFVLRSFFVKEDERKISEKASIHQSVKLGKSAAIGDFVVIKENVEIGDNVNIGENTIIKENTKIYDNVYIGCNCTIGGVGFGYEKDELGEYILIPHIGNVIIKNNVEIGNNTTIDRAVMGSTLLEENVKVDNLVHIAHGVQIGRNSLIIANAMVAGSTVIGENVWVAPSASIINALKVGSNSLIGLGAVVVKDVPENDVVIGNPARSIKK